MVEAFAADSVQLSPETSKRRYSSILFSIIHRIQVFPSPLIPSSGVHWPIRMCGDYLSLQPLKDRGTASSPQDRSSIQPRLYFKNRGLC